MTHDASPTYGPTIKASELVFGDRWIALLATAGTGNKTARAVEFLEFKQASGGTFLLATILDSDSAETYDIVLLDTDMIGPVSRIATRTDRRLPTACVIAHPTQPGKLVLVRRARMGFRAWGASRTAADQYNRSRGATHPLVHAAMQAGATLGWDHPTARLDGDAS